MTQLCRTEDAKTLPQGNFMCFFTMWLKSWEQVAKNIAPFFSIHFDSKKTQLLDFCTIWFGKKTWYPTTYTPNSSKVLEDWESSRYALTRDLQAFSLGSANAPRIKFLLTRSLDSCYRFTSLPKTCSTSSHQLRETARSGLPKVQHRAANSSAHLSSLADPLQAEQLFGC